jgi:hypothetical protein
MPGLQVDLPIEMLKQIASEAILNAISPEQRDTLVRNAVAYLVTPPENRSYGPSYSPITQAFHDGIRSVAIRIAMEMFEKDETVRLKIRELLNEALEKVMVANREKTVQRIGEAIVDGMAYREGR